MEARAGIQSFMEKPSAGSRQVLRRWLRRLLTLGEIGLSLVVNADTGQCGLQKVRPSGRSASCLRT